MHCQWAPAAFDRMFAPESFDTNAGHRDGVTSANELDVCLTMPDSCLSSGVITAGPCGRSGSDTVRSAGGLTGASSEPVLVRLQPSHYSVSRTSTPTVENNFALLQGHFKHVMLT